MREEGDSGVYCQPVENKWSACLMRTVKGRVKVYVNVNANVNENVNEGSSARVNVSVGVSGMVRPRLRESALLIRVMSNVSRRNQMERPMLEAEHG